MKLIFIVSITMLLGRSSYAQSLKQLKNKAAAAYRIGDYVSALKLYKAVQVKRPKDASVKYKTALCYFYKNDLTSAIPYFEFYVKSDNPDPEAYYYAARSFHLVNKFEKAAYYYKRYLKTLPSNDTRRKEFKRLILQCINGIQLVVLDKKAIVSTLGDQINTSADEFGITFNLRTPNVLYFSSNQKGTEGGRTDANGKEDLVDGTFKSDVFKATLDQGRWTKGQALSKRYNTAMDEAVIAFPDGGYQMLFSRGTSLEQAQVLIDNFDEDTVSVAIPFASKTFKQKDYWEGDHFFFTDSILLFSNSKPSGYGGKDLYYSLQMSNGKWTPARNLGPNINTPHDEVSPFLSKDGRTLYFSSNKPEGMGGLDIYKAVFDDETRLWSTSENMLPPINSSGDDFDFHLAKDGLSAYFSSERAECIGGTDLFSAYFRSYLPEQMMWSQPRSFTDILLVVTESIVDNRPDENINKVTTNKDTTNKEPKEIRETFMLAPIYYENTTGDIVGGQNIIKSLTKLLTKYPNVRVLLTAHADNTGQASNDLFLTVKQAEDLAKDLVKSGAKNESIWIQGCGQNYPIATNQNFDGSPNALGHKMNRRINIKVFNIQNEPIAVNIIEPTVSTVMSRPEYAQYSKRIEGLIYRVEVTETATMYSNSVLQDFAHTLTEKRPNDINVRYLVGIEKKFVDAKNLHQSMLNKGFSGAKVIPYINGTRVDPTEAQTLFKVYPDLGSYLDFIADK
ncbi:MAG: tetratricopeptide repeat protein [Aureispira sp.]|nr:tetratricopeptide repeat protein [Aureispira sp.]